MEANRAPGIFLDVDPSIVEQNLCFARDPQEQEFNRMFQPPPEQVPSKLVKPFPGFCVKTREVGSDTKLFINICHTEAIPAPQDITQNELAHILESDEPSTFRVPMSIGDIRFDKDQREKEAKVCDIAIHPNFFKKIETVELFKHFFMTIVFEGLQNKHGIITHDEKIILKNRKCFGTLQVHRIQQREIEEKMKKVNSSIIEEIKENKSKPLIETISSNKSQFKIPEYRLIRRKIQSNCLIGEFKFPDIISAKELTLDVGEDRIIIESSSKNYLLDIFIPLTVRQNSCSSTFNKSTKILTVTMPLVGG